MNIEDQIRNYFKKEENGVLSSVQHLDIADHDAQLLLVAPKGGVTLLNVHCVAPSTLPVVGANSFELDLQVYRRDGTIDQHIHLVNANTATLPFTANNSITWPPMGRFDIFVEESNLVMATLTKTGAPSGSISVQLDYLRGGR